MSGVADIHCEKHLVPQAASRTAQRKVGGGGEMEAQLHKQTDLLPSRSEVLSYTNHCAKCLLTSNPPIFPTSMNAIAQRLLY